MATRTRASSKPQVRDGDVDPEESQCRTATVSLPSLHLCVGVPILVIFGVTEATYAGQK